MHINFLSFFKLCLRPVEGSRGSGGQIKALWTRVTTVLVVHLRALERKTVPTGGLWLLELRGPRVWAAPSLRLVGGRGRGEGRLGLGAGIWGRGAASANEPRWMDLRLGLVLE